MPSPSRENVITAMTDTLRIALHHYEAAQSNSDNYLGDETTLLNSNRLMEPQYGGPVVDFLRQQRAAHIRMIRAAKRAMDSLLLQFAVVQGFKNVTDPGRAARLFRDDLVANSDSVLERNFTYDTVDDVGTPAGDGTGHVLTVDKDAENIENCHAQTVTFECVTDISGGAIAGNEVFEVYGGGAGADELEVAGTGALGTITVLSSDNSLLENSSFGGTESGSGTDKIPGWTISGAASNVSLDSANTFRSAEEEGDDAGSLSFGAAEKVYQVLENSVGALDEGPYILGIFVNRAIGSFSGTFDISLGSNTKSTAYAAQTGWNLQILDLDENLYRENFTEAALDVEFEVSAYTSGDLKADGAFLAKLVELDGLFYALVSGATAWLEGDKLDAAHTAAASDTAVWQFFFWRWYGVSLPNVASSETISDPT